MPAPLFFDPRGLSKGHVFLHGQAVGRYWRIGLQRTLYLPECWMREQNRLVVFDDEGLRPTDARLVRDPRAPVSMVLA